MGTVAIIAPGRFGQGFIPPEFLPEGKDEYYLRNEQQSRPVDQWRNLHSSEIETLVKNGNTCDDWDYVLVTERFAPDQIKNTEFSGLVRIGCLENTVLEYHDLRMPAGITNSRIISCDIGDNAAIHDVRYLAHYIIGDRNILMSIDEMHTTDHAKFGNGVVKEGESEKVRVWLDLMNETGGRRVAPFEDMIPADAYIWLRYRGDNALQTRLTDITQRSADARRGYYGTTGEDCVIKSCRIVKDVRVGSCCYIKGANKLKNLTIKSSAEEPTQIGEGVEMVNGIVGYGCHVFYGSKAVRFVMGNNTNLKYGARLLNSVLGDNSTISCCEILFNLIFPAHEQHHNNSFLTASLVMGQSNLAAGATVGSNHNSRANDGEVQAGRGFWPGLCVTLKHSCRFASFTLLAKGDYPAEMNIPLPFSLVSDDETNGRLQIMPAFWWLYDMYALARNTWKFQTRDTRITKVQNVEFDSLAPDTAEEMIEGRRLLAIWTAKARLRAQGAGPEGKTDRELETMGAELLGGAPEQSGGLEVLGELMECSSRPTVILKAREGYQAYGDMLHYYAVKNLAAFMELDPARTVADTAAALGAEREREWVNLGGQLAPLSQVEVLLGGIKDGTLDSWTDIHRAYDSMWEEYPLRKQRHAMAVLLELAGETVFTRAVWHKALDRAVVIQEYVRDQVHSSRAKDFENPFRRATFLSDEEMRAVVGTIDDNSFVGQVAEETERFRERVAELKKRR